MNRPACIDPSVNLHANIPMKSLKKQGNRSTEAMKGKASVKNNECRVCKITKDAQALDLPCLLGYITVSTSDEAVRQSYQAEVVKW